MDRHFVATAVIICLPLSSIRRHALRLTFFFGVSSAFLREFFDFFAAAIPSEVPWLLRPHPFTEPSPAATRFHQMASDRVLHPWLHVAASRRLRTNISRSLVSLTTTTTSIRPQPTTTSCQSFSRLLLSLKKRRLRNDLNQR